MKLPTTIAKHMLSTVMLVTKQVPNPGVPVVLLHVFPVFVEVVLTVPARVLSATCAAVDTCSPPPRLTDAGIVRSTWPKNATPLLPLSPLLASLLLSWPKVIVLTMLPNFLGLSVGLNFVRNDQRKF